MKKHKQESLDITKVQNGYLVEYYDYDKWLTSSKERHQLVFKNTADLTEWIESNLA